MSLISWFKGTAVNQVYTVSDITDTSKHTGPLPVALTGGGVAATDYGKAEDAAHTSGDVGVMALAVRNDSGAAVLAGTNGDYIPFGLSAQGEVFSVGLSVTAITDSFASANLVRAPNGQNGVAANHPALWNGASLDRQRNNVEGTALASAARTATVNSSDIVNYNGRGVIVFLDVTVASGTGGLTISIEEKDPVSGAYHQVQSGHGPYTTTGQRRAVYYPGASATLAAETVANLATVISRTFRIAISHNDGSSYTYSVGYAIIL